MTINYIISEMTKDAASQIARWHYEPPYDFYDLDKDQDDLIDFLDAANWKHRIYKVSTNEFGLIGFFQFEAEEQNIKIGLGLRPDITGKGYGFSFLLAGLAFAKQQYNARRFVLDVASFNIRAILSYKRSGFKVDSVFNQNTNDEVHEFLRMTLCLVGY